MSMDSLKQENEKLKLEIKKLKNEKNSDTVIE